MALIKCAECGKDVSEKAAACPHCGNPISPPPINPLEIAPEAPVLIEETGKQFKATQLVGAVLVLLGMASCILIDGIGVGAGIWLSIAGFVVYLLGQIGAWWYHA